MTDFQHTNDDLAVAYLHTRGLTVDDIAERFRDGDGRALSTRAVRAALTRVQNGRYVHLTERRPA